MTFTVTTGGGSSVAGLVVGQEVIVCVNGELIKISITKVEENGNNN